MISKNIEKNRICKEYKQVENYEAAIADKEELWVLHHRKLEPSRVTKKDLIERNEFYDVAPEELIFLTRSEHMRVSNEGKTYDKSVKDKISQTKVGKKRPQSVRDALRYAHLGKHRYNNGEVEIWATECPLGFKPGMLPRKKKEVK